MFERRHICHYPTQISACFLSLSDIYSTFLFLFSCSLVNSSSKWEGNYVAISSLAASSLSSMHRSSARRKKNGKRLSNKRKDDWKRRVPDGKRDKNARRLFSSPSLILARFLSFFFNRNEKELVAVFVFDTLFFSFGIIMPNMICLASSTSFFSLLDNKICYIYC